MSDKRPLILGLTGSIGMGKSTVAAMFSQLDVPVFDADALVHRMQGPGGDLLPAIEAEFPGSTDEHGVKRDVLGTIVFANDDALARLEAIIHPAVRRAREEFLAANCDAPLIVFDIPLLFEKGTAREMDRILVVSAPAPVQRARVLARPGMNAEKLSQILARQMPDAEKRARADFVIDTGTALDETASKVSALVAKLTS